MSTAKAALRRMTRNGPAVEQRYISLRLPTVMVRELDRVAVAQERSRSFLMRKAIAAYVNENRADGSGAAR